MRECDRGLDAGLVLLELAIRRGLLLACLNGKLKIAAAAMSIVLFSLTELDSDRGHVDALIIFEAVASLRVSTTVMAKWAVPTPAADGRWAVATPRGQIFTHRSLNRL